MARLTAKARKVRMNGGGYRNPSRITTGVFEQGQGYG
jgi:hypothetical protein